MVLFADNDVLLKLGACNLLGGLPDLFDCCLDDVRVLASAKPYIRKKAETDDFVQQYTETGIERTLRFVDGCATVTQADVDGDAYAELLMIEGLDVGEAHLLAAAQVTTDDAVVTGDKRCLIALAGAEGLVAARARLEKRIWCFEQTLLRFMAALPFVDLRARVVRGRSCDGVLRDMAFRHGTATTEEHARDALESCVSHLRSRAGDLLASP